MRPFSVKGKRDENKPKEIMSPGGPMSKTTQDFNKNDEDNDHLPTKEERQKMWEELETITAELDKKRQTLLQEFTMVEQGNFSSVFQGPSQEKTRPKEENLEEVKVIKSESKIESQPEEIKEKPEIKKEEIELEKKSHDALAALEIRLRELDVLKAEAFKKLSNYVDTIKNAKDENGNLLIGGVEKIDEVATIMKDYHRETSRGNIDNDLPNVGILRDIKVSEDSEEDVL